ncbi:MAG: hypothetical protein GC200_01035 [Tepidisphaera sp.]|nr:hypothetical protein [Tepidisphaera sp.]
MKRFIAAFFVMQVIKFLVGLRLEWGWLGERGVGPWDRLPVTVLLPTLVAMVVVLWMDRELPRRLFDRRVKQPLTQISFGAAAGFLSAAVSAVATRMLANLAMDFLALVIAAAVTATAVLLSMPRMRPGRCVQCGATLVPGEKRCLNCFADRSDAVPGLAEKMAG